MSVPAHSRSWDQDCVPAGYLVFAIHGDAVAIVPTGEHVRDVISALALAYGVSESRVVVCLPTEVPEVAFYDAMP